MQIIQSSSALQQSSHSVREETVFQSVCPCPHYPEPATGEGVKNTLSGVCAVKPDLFISVSQPGKVDLFLGWNRGPNDFCAVLVIRCRSFLSFAVQLENHTVHP